MPRGLIRYEHTGSFHFLTFSCYHRFQYLGAAEACDLFEDALERVRQRYRFVVAGYVVMPEHVHLPIGEPVKGVVSGVVHALKLQWRCGARSGLSGKLATTTFSCTTKRSAPRNCATCTATLLCAVS